MTRRCNLSCPHCLKGEPQDIDITEDIIDKTLSQVNWANKIFLSGGEPFLAAKQIAYLVNKIIENKIVITEFNVITNGTILDKQISNYFNSISKYIDDTLLASNVHQIYTASITISDDKYHDNTIKKEAFKFYSQNCNSKVKVSFMDRDEREKGNFDDNTLYYSGRAKQQASNYRYQLDSPNHRVEFCTLSEERWKGNTSLYHSDPVKGMFIKCVMEVSCNGNFGIMSNNSFEDDDSNSMGNIFNVSIAQMIDDWQWKHPLYCREIDLKNKAEANIINNRNNINYNSDDDNSMINDINSIENKRKELHHKFKYLTFDEIYKITEILIKLGDAEKTNDLVKQKLCKKQYGEYERIDQEREIQEQFKEHEVIHKKYPNLTPKECEIMDYSIKQINEDWSGYPDKKFVKECKERHLTTIKDLQDKNDSRNTLSGLLKEVFIR